MCKTEDKLSLNVYLVFTDNCREVFEFYRTVFDGEYLAIMTFADGPEEMEILESDQDRIMHVTLSLGDSILMGSDTPSNYPQPLAPGNNFALSYTTQSREEADELFAQLSDGGTVNMPMQETFWGSYFGFCTDKFGINWQIDFELPEE
jgi:PhnB protein